MQPVQIHQIAVGPMANFSYLIEEGTSKTAAYVDPGWEAAQVVALAAKKNLEIEQIWLTHTHFDHIQDLKRAYELTKAPVYVCDIEAGAIEDLGMPVHAIVPEETLKVGSLDVKCLHCPGHTPGMICFYIAPHLITGDMLFVDGCGRVDLPGSDPEKMFESLKRLATLPDDTIIYPGHNYGPSPTSTLGEQKKSNPYLNAAMVGKDLFFQRRGI